MLNCACFFSNKLCQFVTSRTVSASGHPSAPEAVPAPGDARAQEDDERRARAGQREDDGAPARLRGQPHTLTPLHPQEVHDRHLRVSGLSVVPKGNFRQIVSGHIP